MSTPADRIRRVLNFAATLFPQSEAQDALAALAELERERDEATEERELFRKMIVEQRQVIDDLERAPTVAWLATQQQRNPSQCVVTTKMDDGWDHVELIARPARERERQEPVGFQVRYKGALLLVFVAGLKAG